MTVEFFNGYYFAFILLDIFITVGLYFLLKNKSTKTKKLVIAGLLFFNLALHFIKLLFPPYSSDPDKAMRDVWFINICAVSVLVFPFIFLSKNKTWKDFMFYLGVLSGGLALLIPTEALGESPFVFDTLRFYAAHMIIIIAPILMISLKVHELDYKRIYKMPFCMMIYMLFIICNQVLQSELGIVPLRGNDITDITYRNNSLIWGPDEDFGKLFSIFTPNFMKTVPYGAFKGTAKYWPFFWITPSLLVYFTTLPLLLSLPTQRKVIWADLKKLFKKKKTS